MHNFFFVFYDISLGFRSIPLRSLRAVIRSSYINYGIRASVSRKLKFDDGMWSLQFRSFLWHFFGIQKYPFEKFKGHDLNILC